MTSCGCLVMSFSWWNSTSVYFWYVGVKAELFLFFITFMLNAKRRSRKKIVLEKKYVFQRPSQEWLGHKDLAVRTG